VSPFRPERPRPIRFLSPAFLVGLILAAGTVDSVLPVVVSASIGESEPVDPPFDDFCRIRRDGVTDLRTILVMVRNDDAPRPEGTKPPDTLRFRVPPGHPRLATGFEHRSRLRLRSRSPGPHRG
jgi:hypothetical protein